MPLLILALALGQPPLPIYPQPLPGPGYPPPLPPYPTVPLPLPEPEGYSPLRPIGVETFAKTFAPTPGIHNVWFLHPRTKKAVYVTFVLPEGCGCPKVKSGKRYVKFDYHGHRDVEVCFKLFGGGVEVEY